MTNAVSKIGLGLTFFLTFSTAGNAQVTGSDCTQLAAVIAAGESVAFNSTDSESVKYYATCEASSKSNKSGLSIAYGAFSLGGSYDDQKAKEYCSKKKENYNISAVSYTKSKVVFDRALNVIEACIAATQQRGWGIKYTEVHKNSVSITLTNTLGNGGDLIAVDLLPDGSIKCKGMPDKFPYTVKTTPVSLLCTREENVQTVNGVTITSAPEVTINLRLDDNQIPIKMVAYNSSVIDKIYSEINRVEGVLAAFKAETSARLSKIGSGGSAMVGATGDNSGLDKNVVQCPPGYYAAGLKGWGAVPSVRYCIGCFTGVQLYCRPFVN